MEMCRRGFLNMARLTMLTVDTYMRPGEILGLRGSSLISPQPRLGRSYRHYAVLAHPWAHGRASKVGQFDESIMLDSPNRLWMNQLAAKLLETRSKAEFLADFSYREWATVWRSCCLTLGLPAATLYVLRHTGASDDRLRRNRSLPEIKRRGRWASETSVKRYEKSARTMAVIEHWPPRLLQHLRLCENLLSPVLLGKKAAIQPPINLPRVEL